MKLLELYEYRTFIYIKDYKVQCVYPIGIAYVYYISLCVVDTKLNN